MQETSKYMVFNIREYLNNGNYELGEDDLYQILSEFSCPINPDDERFIKNQAIEFTRKQQSVTYLVFAAEDAELVGYFALAVKPIVISAQSFSKTSRKKLARVSRINESTYTYSLTAYLIAQLGKNYQNGANERISGRELLGLALEQVRHIQNEVGGMVVFLEANNEEKLLSFYQANGFRQFDTRKTSSEKEEPHELVQLLKIL